MVPVVQDEDDDKGDDYPPLEERLRERNDSPSCIQRESMCFNAKIL